MVEIGGIFIIHQLYLKKRGISDFLRDTQNICYISY